jgi:hypothetical protein
MTLPVWIHASWMIIAVAIGTWSGYLGLVRATLRGGKSPLPGRYSPGLHKWTGIAYYVMLYVGILYGKIMVDFLLGNGEPAGIWLWHEHLAYAIGIIYFPAMLLGLRMLSKPPGARRAVPVWHMILNFTACTLVGVQILLTVYAVWQGH